MNPFQQWIVSATGLIERVFGVDSPHAKTIRGGHAEFNRRGAYDDVVAQCTGPFHAAREDFESGALFRTRSLLRAELGEDVLSQAEDLACGSVRHLLPIHASDRLVLAWPDGECSS